jgi:hypothetical protein
MRGALSYIRANARRNLFTGLLDLYPVAAAAYSLRALSASFVNSDLVLVRRSSDNAELGFTATEITDGTLTTWTGANDGFVVTWYDQSGNSRNATQSTAGNQPKIVSAGALVVDAVTGNPALAFDGVNDTLKASDYIVRLSQNPASVFAVSRQAAITLNSYLLAEADVESYSSNFIFGGAGTFGNRIIWVNSSEFGTMPTGLSLVGFDWNQSVFQAYANGVASGSSGSATVNAEVLGGTVIGSRADQTANFLTGQISEIISYQSNQSANRTEIDANLKAAWGTP